MPLDLAAFSLVDQVSGLSFDFSAVLPAVTFSNGIDLQAVQRAFSTLPELGQLFRFAAGANTPEQLELLRSQIAELGRQFSECSPATDANGGGR